MADCYLQCLLGVVGKTLRPETPALNLWKINFGSPSASEYTVAEAQFCTSSSRAAKAAANPSAMKVAQKIQH